MILWVLVGIRGRKSEGREKCMIQLRLGFGILFSG